jgi:adenine-specific DNA-methyltransferase
MSINLSDNEKRDVIKYLETGKPLPEKYRFLLFDDDREVELIWNGKTDEVTNLVLPFQTIEHIDEPRSEQTDKMQMEMFDTSGRQIKGWTNKLIWGDNKLILSSLKNGPLRKEIEEQGGLKLIYIDPPFDVGADFSMDVEIGDEQFTKKPSIIEEIAYRDTWGKGADSFIAMIYERLSLMRDLLADDGSIYVHCDWRLSAFLKLVLDEIFGKNLFRREIIWNRDEPFGYKASSNNYAHTHDSVLYYAKSDSVLFNKVYNSYSEKYLSAKFVHDDNDGLGKYRIRELGSEKNKQYLKDSPGVPMSSVITIKGVNSMAKERVNYPTQKPEELIDVIINASSNENDLIADFFCGSGSTLASAEKLSRKWIGADLGRFSVHTTRKRMIGVQRELKKEGKDFRAFEILNIGKYEREYYVGADIDLRKEEKQKVLEQKGKEFVKLILAAYRAEPVDSFTSFVGKKRDRLVAVGPINNPVTISFIEEIVAECQSKGILKADILGFDYEMGIDFSETRNFGLGLQFKVIPREVFDKKAVEKGQVKFYDVAYIEVKPIVKKKSIAVGLCDFSVFYNQDDTGEIAEKLQSGGSKIIIEDGKVIKVTKDKVSDIIERTVLTQKWTDWVDYWAVDYNFGSKKEIVRVKKEKKVAQKLDGSHDPVQSQIDDYEEKWTGNYIFENEWQSFRTKKDRGLELTSATKEVLPGKYKIAVKVVDIFGNDTTKVIEVTI